MQVYLMERVSTSVPATYRWLLRMQVLSPCSARKAGMSVSKWVEAWHMRATSMILGTSPPHLTTNCYGRGVFDSNMVTIGRKRNVMDFFIAHIIGRRDFMLIWQGIHRPGLKPR